MACQEVFGEISVFSVLRSPTPNIMTMQEDLHLVGTFFLYFFFSKMQAPHTAMTEKIQKYNTFFFQGLNESFQRECNRVSALSFFFDLATGAP